MATPFVRSMRYLQSDGFNQSVQVLIRSTLLLLVWTAWFMLTRVDVLVVARGVVRPERTEVPVMPSIQARVQEVRIREGDRVERGQVLFVLESRVAATESAGLQRQKEALDQVRREEATQLPLEEARVEDDLHSEGGRLDGLQQMLAQLGSERANRQRERDEAVHQHEIERSRREDQRRQVQLDLQQAERNLRTAKEVLETNRRLAAQQLVSRLAVLELENKYQNARTEVDKQQAEVRRASQALQQEDASIAQVDAALATVLSDVSRREQELRLQVAGATSRIEQLEHDLSLLRQRSHEKVVTADAEYRKTLAQAGPGLAERHRTPGPSLRPAAESGRFEVTSPVTGRVASLQVKEAGTFVSPGSVMLRLLPENEPLLFEATVANRDMGQLRTGVDARIKLDAYPVEQYGAVLGQVVWVAPDSELHPQLGLAYRIRCRIDSHPPAIPLSPGLAGSVEMICGKRRIVDMVLQNIREIGETRS